MTPDLCAVIDEKPGEGWSPEQISGRMRLESRPVDGSDSHMAHFFLSETFARIEDLCPG